MAGPTTIGRMWCVALCALAVALAPTHSLADEFREPGAHWKLSSLDGWQPLQPESIQRANDMVKSLGGDHANWSYTSGLKRAGAPDLEYPYILIQLTRADFRGASADDLERTFAAMPAEVIRRLNDSPTGWMSGASINKPMLDRATGRTYMTSQSEVKGVGAIRGSTIGFLGTEGLITLNYYNRATDFDKGLPDFQKIVDAFAYDQGYAFIPSARGFSWSSVLAKGLTGAIIGGAIGAVVGLFRWWQRKRRAA